MNASRRVLPFLRLILSRSYCVSAPKKAGKKQHIPAQYLSLRRAGKPENLYLICPKVAKIIASHVKPSIASITKKQIIADTNAGLGLITTELLESGVTPIRLYELCAEFRAELKDFGNLYVGQVELFTKDLFHLHWYSYMDRQDRGRRVELLLKDVPKRSWSDDPAITIVGAMPQLSFLKYLIQSLCVQKEIVDYGRFQIFAIMKPSHFAVLKATPLDSLFAYQYWTVLFSLFMEYELLEEIPRNVYLPWESPPSKGTMMFYPFNYDLDKLYLVKLNFKKELPLPVEQLLPLYYFGKHMYGRGSNKIVPTIEKWVPGCGLNILLPKLEHPDYFENMDIFTKFRELTPPQLLAVFKELINYPSFSSSSFQAMIESNLLKTETVETDLAESPSEKNVDIQQRVGTE